MNNCVYSIVDESKYPYLIQLMHTLNSNPNLNVKISLLEYFNPEWTKYEVLKKYEKEYRLYVYHVYYIISQITNENITSKEELDKILTKCDTNLFELFRESHNYNNLESFMELYKKYSYLEVKAEKLTKEKIIYELLCIEIKNIIKIILQHPEKNEDIIKIISNLINEMKELSYTELKEYYTKYKNNEVLLDMLETIIPKIYLSDNKYIECFLSLDELVKKYMDPQNIAVKNFAFNNINCLFKNIDLNMSDKLLVYIKGLVKDYPNIPVQQISDNNIRTNFKSIMRYHCDFTYMQLVYLTIIESSTCIFQQYNKLYSNSAQMIMKINKSWLNNIMTFFDKKVCTQATLKDLEEVIKMLQYLNDDKELKSAIEKLVQMKIYNKNIYYFFSPEVIKKLIELLKQIISTEGYKYYCTTL